MTPGVGRIRNGVRRSLRATRRASSAIASIRPRRSIGAVQGPLIPRATATDVWGWAWLGTEEVAAVHVTVDGVVVAAAMFEASPRDVLDRFPDARDSLRCGWRATIDFAPYRGRRVSLGAIVISAHGSTHEVDALHVDIAEDRASAIGAIDSPVAGTIAAGAVRVAGWVISAAGPPTRIDVRVDGRAAGSARAFVLPSMDLASTSREPSAPLAGFEHVVIVDGAPGAPISIDVEVIDRSGARWTLPPVTISIDDERAELESDRERALVLDARVRATERRPRLGDGPELRVAVFTHQLDLGGGQLYLQELLRGILRDPSVSCLVVSAADGPLRAELELAGAIVHVTTYPMASLNDYMARMLELAHLVRTHDANLVLGNTMMAGIGADLARRLDIPVVWAIHESYRLEEFWSAAYGERGIHPEVSSMVTDALRAAAAVVFEAESTRTAYLGNGDERRFVTVPYGIDPSTVSEYLAIADRSNTRQLLELADDAVAILSVGMFEARKAHASLVFAFADLAAEFPNAVLIIVGDNNSPYAVALREVVHRLNLGTRVRLEPATPAIYEWYLASDAFVLASDVESMPRTLLEVMTFGVPVAASAVWGVPVLVNDGENGLLFEPRDLTALTDALRRLLTMDSDERGRMGAAGARTVREQYDSSGYIEAYQRLLRGLVDDPTALPSDLLAS